MPLAGCISLLCGTKAFAFASDPFYCAAKMRKQRQIIEETGCCYLHLSLGVSCCLNIAKVTQAFCKMTDWMMNTVWWFSSCFVVVVFRKVWVATLLSLFHNSRLGVFGEQILCACFGKHDCVV